MAPTDDDLLVRRVVHHDRSALEALYWRHGSAVVTFARSMLRDVSLADDVVQDVFLWLWERPDRFQPERGSLRNFLLLQARGRAIETIRNREARCRREERAARLDGHGGFAEGVEDATLVADDHRRLHSVLFVLNDNERAAIELAFFGGMTYQEVAASLCLAEGTVKSRIRRGLQRLTPAVSDLGLGVP